MRHRRVRRLAHALCAGLACAGPGAAWAQDGAGPLSSIDWLSDSLAEEAALRPLPRAPRDTVGGVRIEAVTVAPLDAPVSDGAGLAGPVETGLPATLWGAGSTDGIAERLARFPLDGLPAARDAFRLLLTARLDPPRGGGTPGTLLLARIDALLAMGALDEADALIRAAGADRPDLFRRAFDIGLLRGSEDEGCARLKESPGIAPSLPVRIFCLARSGDWPAAALTLETADALGQLSALEDALLARFLEPELAEGVPPLARLPAPSPLEWRMLEAIGERQPTSGLPRAFAHADLRETAGWKTRLEATERLVRAGALPVQALCTVYTERNAAASGGIWDRVAAKQAFDAAVAAGDATGVGAALRDGWELMAAAGLGLAFAEMTAPHLPRFALTGEAATLAHRMHLLARAAAPGIMPPPDTTPTLADRIAVAAPLGEPALSDGDAIRRAVARAFSEPRPDAPPTVRHLAEWDRLGEALLEALQIVARGAEADPEDLAGALSFLRTAGMEETARRAAIQILLLDGAA
ncbi:MAG: hypothetical protein AAGG09_03445 [Pseudomonadota bacterium]